MNTVFLILYLWNASGSQNRNAGGTGGPAFQMIAVPSLPACEALGKAAKELIDANRPDKAPALYWKDDRGEHDPTFNSPPTVYRCVPTGSSEAAKTAPVIGWDPHCTDKAIQITGLLGTPATGCIDPRQHLTIEQDGHGHGWAICRCGQK